MFIFNCWNFPFDSLLHLRDRKWKKAGTANAKYKKKHKYESKLLLCWSRILIIDNNFEL